MTSMNLAEQSNLVIDQLGQVLDKGNLPAPYDRCGARLLAHLTRPVQVVVTGIEGSGKSMLIEMMSAIPGVGKTASVPIYELAYGQSTQAMIERSDGSVSWSAGTLASIPFPKDTIRARQELPDTNLLQQEFVEISLRGSMEQRQKALNAAISRADLMIWCSQEFTDDEANLWSSVPEHIKDHSVLALTKADRQVMRGVLEKNIARLEPIVANEFLGLFPVATIQGVNARTRSEEINTSLWTSSGGQSLMNLLARQIRQGRNADMDQARIFLDRLAVRMPDTPKPEDQQAANADQKPSTATTNAAAQNVPFSESEDPDDQTVIALSEAAEILQKRAEALLNEVDQSETLDTDHILESCSEALSSVGQLFELDENQNPVATAAQEDLEEGEEMMMLFQLERGEDAALDAVTLVLQMRKELIDKLPS